MALFDRIGRIALRVVGLLIAALQVGCANGGSGPIRIGVAGPFTDPIGRPMLLAAQLAAEEINASGGNVTVEIESKDSKGDQTQTLTAAQELLDDGVLVQVLTTAEPSVAVGQLVSAAGGMTTVGGNTAPSIPRDIGERSVSIVFGDNLQASAMARAEASSHNRSGRRSGSSASPSRFLKFSSNQRPVYFPASASNVPISSQ